MTVGSDTLKILLEETVQRNPYIPIQPSPPQGAFLASLDDEVLYGGAAGGGKSVGLLASALMFVGVEGYQAILLRRTFADLNKPDALIPLSHKWLRGTDAAWNGTEHRWRFPSGATLDFGYCQNEMDIYQYQGAQYQFIGVDELTQWPRFCWAYLASRARKCIGLNVPVRLRAGANPGGIGHDWVKEWFAVRGQTPVFRCVELEDGDFTTRRFIPAKLDDNPHLDKKDYNKKLRILAGGDLIVYEQLRNGDWDVAREDGVFDVAGLALQNLVKPGRTGRIVEVKDGDDTPSGETRDYGDGVWRFIDDGPLKDGMITVWEYPDEAEPNYVLGFDAAYGLKSADFDYAVVIDRKTNRQVAEAQGHWGENFFEIVHALYRFYGSAFIVGERQVGLPTLRRLYRRGDAFMYFNRKDSSAGRPMQDCLGHHSHAGDLVIPDLRRAIGPRDDEGKLLTPRVWVRSAELHRQLKAYVFIGKTGAVDIAHAADSDLTYGAPPGDHDDGVRALSFAWRGIQEVAKFDQAKPKVKAGSAADRLGLADVMDDPDDDGIEDDDL